MNALSEQDMRELAMGVVERLTGHDEREITEALADPDPGEDARALRGDFGAVYDALCLVAAPLNTEIELVKQQRDLELAKRLRAAAERDNANTHLRMLQGLISSTAGAAEARAGRIREHA